VPDGGLDRRSAKELHDLAVSYARRHHDGRFFVELIETLPAAEAAAGEIDKMEADVMELGAHSTTSPTPAGARPPRRCGRTTWTTSGVTASRRRERRVVITRYA
jgi:hypothetical protein